MEQENHQQRQQILELQTLLTAKDEQLTSKDDQLAGKDYQLQQKKAAIAAHQQEIWQLRQQLHTQSDQLHSKDDQLQQMEQENQQQSQQILGLRTVLTTKDEQLAGKDNQLQQNETAMAIRQQEIQELRQELQSSEQVAAEFKRNLEVMNSKDQENFAKLDTRRLLIEAISRSQISYVHLIEWSCSQAPTFRHWEYVQQKRWKAGWMGPGKQD